MTTDDAENQVIGLPKPFLHVGMNSGAGFEFEGEAAVTAYLALSDATDYEPPFGFATVVDRDGFKQYLNVAHIEAIDWYPQGMQVDG